MRTFILLLAGTTALTSCTAQENSDGLVASAGTKAASAHEINWLSFEEAVALHEKAPKKLIIDVYTHWCGWCKKMDKTTFVDPDVVSEINGNFYAVKLDAERKDDVSFRDKVFVFKPEYKAHELAIGLLQGKMSYPSYVFLDESFAMISPIPGYKTKKEMMQLLGFFSNDAYKTKTWEDYLAGAAGATK